MSGSARESWAKNACSLSARALGRNLGARNRPLQVYARVRGPLAVGASGRREPVQRLRVGTENALLHRRGECWITEPCLHLRGDDERAERVDQRLRRSVPRAIGPPNNAFRA